MEQRAWRQGGQARIKASALGLAWRSPPSACCMRRARPPGLHTWHPVLRSSLLPPTQRPPPVPSQRMWQQTKKQRIKYGHRDWNVGAGGVSAQRATLPSCSAPAPHLDGLACHELARQLLQAQARAVQRAPPDLLVREQRLPGHLYKLWHRFVLLQRPTCATAGNMCGREALWVLGPQAAPQQTCLRLPCVGDQQLQHTRGRADAGCRLG